MPTVTTNYFRRELAGGNITLSADAFKVSLMNNIVSSATGLQSINTWAQVSANEVSATSYSAVDLTAGTLTIVGNTVKWDGTDVSWSNVTLSAKGLSIYRSNDGLVVGFIEFPSTETAVNGAITIAWNANGIMNIN
jgi:hypothetical protein